VRFPKSKWNLLLIAMQVNQKLKFRDVCRNIGDEMRKIADRTKKRLSHCKNYVNKVDTLSGGCYIRFYQLVFWAQAETQKL
jgi:hypothetical protein